MLLQSVGGLGNQFILPNEKDGQLRDINLLDLKADDTKAKASIAEVFAMLPNKTKDPRPEEAEAYRLVSDLACKLSFASLRTPADLVAFKQAARSLLCVKATRDPHDLKYPVAAFKDTTLANSEWRPTSWRRPSDALDGIAIAGLDRVGRSAERAELIGTTSIRGFRLASRMVAALASHSLWAGITCDPGAGGGESISIRNRVVPMDLFDDHICILSAETRTHQQVF